MEIVSEDSCAGLGAGPGLGSAGSSNAKPSIREATIDRLCVDESKPISGRSELHSPSPFSAVFRVIRRDEAMCAHGKSYSRDVDFPIVNLFFVGMQLPILRLSMRKL